MKKIELTIEQLEELLREQRKLIAEHITRNLSVYSSLDNTTKEELKRECWNAPMPDDFRTLKKYLS